MSQEHDDINDVQEPKRWQGLARANVLNTTTLKLFGYIQLADQKAMGLILLNSAIIPLAMNWLHKGSLDLPATISVITGVASVFMAIWCIFPKRGRRANKEINPLHFNDIGGVSEEEYLRIMMPVYNDHQELAEHVLKDVHAISQKVLIPKFRLLKTSYIIFFTDLFTVQFY